MARFIYFSMDAIECGIVKLPRVPLADNIQTDFKAKVEAEFEKLIESVLTANGRE